MEWHRIGIFEPQIPKDTVENDIRNKNKNKYKFTVLDVPLFLLRFLNWIISKNEKESKAIILIVIAVTVNILGMVTNIMYLYGFLKLIFHLPVIKKLNVSNLYNSIFSFIFLWKLWRGNIVEKFTTHLHDLNPNYSMQLITIFYIVAIYLCTGLAMGYQIHSITQWITFQDNMFHFIPDSNTRLALAFALMI